MGAGMVLDELYNNSEHQQVRNNNESRGRVVLTNVIEDDKPSGGDMGRLLASKPSFGGYSMPQNQHPHGNSLNQNNSVQVEIAETLRTGNVYPQTMQTALNESQLEPMTQGGTETLYSQMRFTMNQS